MKQSEMKIHEGETLSAYTSRIADTLHMDRQQRIALEEVSKQSYIQGSHDALLINVERHNRIIDNIIALCEEYKLTLVS